MMHAKLWNHHNGALAIEGCLEVLAGAGVLCGHKVAMGSIEEKVEVDHVEGHVFLVHFRTCGWM
jgi:hypothetical protein